MPVFSKTSLDRLSTCDEKLQKLFQEVIKKTDCIIICGYRGEKEQNEAYRNGFSRLKFPYGKHNHFPSLAVDVMPYFEKEPHVRWNNRLACEDFAEIVLETAKEMDIDIVWGGSWKTFIDLPHFELRVKNV